MEPEPLLDPPGLDPIEVFTSWYAAAEASGQPEPEAMALATSNTEGVPSVRFVLLRAFDRQGFVFFTNRRSQKGLELASNPHGSVAFRWHVVARQVRAAGPVTEVADGESDAYFASRPIDSQRSAWASEQSSPLQSRAVLARQMAQVEERFGDGPVPRPPWWGGYRLEPKAIEFWQQGPSRLHDRFLYRLAGDGWTCQRLSP